MLFGNASGIKTAFLWIHRSAKIGPYGQASRLRQSLVVYTSMESQGQSHFRPKRMVPRSPQRSAMIITMADIPVCSIMSKTFSRIQYFLIPSIRQSRDFVSSSTLTVEHTGHFS